MPELGPQAVHKIYQIFWYYPITKNRLPLYPSTCTCNLKYFDSSVRLGLLLFHVWLCLTHQSIPISNTLFAIAHLLLLVCAMIDDCPFILIHFCKQLKSYLCFSIVAGLAKSEYNQSVFTANIRSCFRLFIHGFFVAPLSQSVYYRSIKLPLPILIRA